MVKNRPRCCDAQGSLISVSNASVCSPSRVSMCSQSKLSHFVPVLFSRSRWEQDRTLDGNYHGCITQQGSVKTNEVH